MINISPFLASGLHHDQLELADHSDHMSELRLDHICSVLTCDHSLAFFNRTKGMEPGEVSLICDVVNQLGQLARALAFNCDALDKSLTGLTFHIQTDISH